MQVKYILYFYLLLCTAYSLKIALHAQVSPNEKIVGSVITTDGEHFLYNLNLYH